MSEIRSEATGADHRMDAKYLIAADGAGSRTRRNAGIEMVGPATLAVMLNEYWRGRSVAPADWRARRRAIIVIPDKPGVPRAGILNTNGRDRWLTRDADRLTEGRAAAALDRCRR